MPHSDARRHAYLTAARTAGRRWRSYLGVATIAVAGAAALVFIPGVPARPGAIALVLGTVAVLVSLSLIDTPTPGSDGRMGAQWNLPGLRRVPGWQVTDGVDQVDHVVVAPAAVLAVETDYLKQPVAGAESRYQDDLARCESAAHTIRQSLRADEPGEAAVVVPVLMMHGPGATELVEGHRLDRGVHVVDGEHPERWVHLFNAPSLTTAGRRELHARFEQQARQADLQAARSQLSLRRQLWHEFRTAAAAERSESATRPDRRRSASGRPQTFTLVSAPVAAVVPTAAPVAARTTQVKRVPRRA